MNDILSPAHADVLAQLARSRALLAFDFDGTLAPIVEDRDRAVMRERTRKLLVRLSALYPCAVISGRSLTDVAARLGGAAVQHVVGNHGLEPGTSMAACERDIRYVRPLLEQALRTWSDLDIEDKRFSLALHYRRSRRKRDTRVAICNAVAGLPVRMRVIPGKLVLNVVPQPAPNKGDALTQLQTLAHADTALYVGDDVTDEDVFRLDQPGRLVTVRVGESTSSAAAYFVRTQRDVDALLARMVDFRESRLPEEGR